MNVLHQYGGNYGKCVHVLEFHSRNILRFDFVGWMDVSQVIIIYGAFHESVKGSSSPDNLASILLLEPCLIVFFILEELSKGVGVPGADLPCLSVMLFHKRWRRYAG